MKAEDIRQGKRAREDRRAREEKLRRTQEEEKLRQTQEEKHKQERPTEIYFHQGVDIPRDGTVTCRSKGGNRGGQRPGKRSRLSKIDQGVKF